MIRINLLGERKKPLITLKAPSGPPKSSFLIILFLGVFVAAGAFLYWRYQALTQEVQDLSAQLASAQKEKQHKQQLLRDIDSFEKRRKLLEARIAVIDQLKKNQLGPIAWLNGLTQAVDQTQTVWLNTVRQNGNQMTIEGVATTLNGVGNFASTLKKTGVFRNVIINESELANVSGLEGYSFSITCESTVSPAETKS